MAFQLQFSQVNVRLIYINKIIIIRNKQIHVTDSFVSQWVMGRNGQIGILNTTVIQSELWTCLLYFGKRGELGE